MPAINPKYGHSGNKLWHREKIEKILGHSLPPKAEVHHRNGSSNSNDNLIVCENRAYHTLIEMRERAYRATGDSNKRKCVFCFEWDSTMNMTKRVRNHAIHQQNYHHDACRRKYEREHYARTKKK